jgi:hypothetical protein
LPTAAINIAPPAIASQPVRSSVGWPGTVQPHPGKSGVPGTHWSWVLQLIASPHGSPKFVQTAASELDASGVDVSETASAIGASVGVVVSVVASDAPVSARVASIVLASVSSVGASATIASLVSKAVASASEPESPVSEALSRPASIAVAHVVPLQPAAPQGVVVAAQAPEPLQALVVATEALHVGAAHCERGSVPAVMFAQVPVA